MENGELDTNDTELDEIELEKKWKWENKKKKLKQKSYDQGTKSSCEHESA